MAVTPSIKELFEKRRFFNKTRRQERITTIYKQYPELQKLDQAIKEQTIHWSIQRMKGETTLSKEELQQEIAGLNQRREQLLDRFGIDKNYLDPIYTCPICQDQGYVNGEYCSCYRQTKMELLFQNSPIYNQMQKENFDTFDFSLFSEEKDERFPISPRECIKRAHHIAQQFVTDFPSGENLLLQGNTGVGKTFLTNCIAKELFGQCYQVTYLSASHFFDILSDYKFHHRNEEQYHFIFHSDLLIIDDLGTEVGNAFIDSALFECINTRFIEEKSTIISTNKTIKQMEEDYSKRVTSRIIEYYKVVPIIGQDLRVKKGFQNV